MVKIFHLLIYIYKKLVSPMMYLETILQIFFHPKNLFQDTNSTNELLYVPQSFFNGFF